MKHAFLSTESAGAREVRVARLAVLVSAVTFLAAVPFSTRPLGRSTGFIPAYEAAFVLGDLITSALLFGQFNVLRSRKLLVLASAYLFTALIAFVHALSFPEAFSPTGLLGAGPQTTVWLYMFWHGGFPLFILAYALLGESRESLAAENAKGSSQQESGRVVLASVAAVFAVVCGFTLVATAGHAFLPVLILNGRFTPALTVVVSGLWLLSLLALVVLWLRKPHTVLDLWLMVVMCAWLCDIALSALLNAARFDFGWYAGRIYGLMSATFLLIVLLFENVTNYARLARLTVALGAANKSLEDLSLHDALTDLANRRYFDRYLADQISIARRHRRCLSLLLFDVDAFKAYNDHSGHQAGDECLRQVAAALRFSCRRTADLAARYGGEEFAIILPDTDLAAATRIAETAREAVAGLKMPHPHSPAAHFVTISGGIAVLSHPFEMTAPELIAAADRALYEAKETGRNRIVSAGDPAGPHALFAGIPTHA